MKDILHMEIIDDQYDPDQQREIEVGEKEGLNVSCYAKKEFMAIQMRQIRLGLEEGLDVSLYAKPEYDWFQMEEIRKGIQAGIDVSLYAFPDVSYDKMRQVRKGLIQGIDLSVFLHLDARILRQQRKAYFSKVNIAEYVKQGYEPEQLEEIRLGLEKGLNIGPYLKKGFRGVAIHEICQGLERGLDVSAYAREEYSWQQMRELRLGLEHRADISQFNNSMYSWRQMREIRLGIEMGLDVTPYRTLMYTSSDMKRIRHDIMSGNRRASIRSRESSVTVDNFLVTISGDEMEAYLEVMGDPEAAYSRDQVLGALQEAGVKIGILKEVIDILLAGKRYHQQILVAKGTQPERGTDGWHEYFFRTKKETGKTYFPDGSVDYGALYGFELVEAGQTVAVYHEAEQGRPGVTVTGKMCGARKGREQAVLSGIGVHLAEDKKTYVAAVGGKIEIKEGQLVVSPNCVRDEILDPSGSIDFDGSVYVRGRVANGVIIRASGDIIIDGLVEGAVLQSGGSILLRQGIKGMGEAHIEAEGHVAARSLDLVRVICQGNIYANYATNSNLHSGGRIVISGSQSVISGGLAQAVKGIQAGQVGDPSGNKILLKLGVTDDALERQWTLERKIQKVNKELSMLGNIHLKFQRKYPPEVRNNMEAYLKIEAAIYTKEMQQEKLYKKKLKVEEEIQKMSDTELVVLGNLYEGTAVEIDKIHWNAMTISNVTVKKEGDRIAVYNN